MEKPAEKENTKKLLGLLEKLLANWPVEQSRVPVLSLAFKRIFDEVGESRFAEAVSNIIRDGDYQFFPTVAEFRGWIPKKPDSERGERDDKLKEKHEFNGLIREIDGLEANAASRADKRQYFLFQRSRSIGILHWWLRQHPDSVERLPDHLAWVTDYAAMERYVDEHPAYDGYVRLKVGNS